MYYRYYYLVYGNYSIGIIIYNMASIVWYHYLVGHGRPLCGGRAVGEDDDLAASMKPWRRIISIVILMNTNSANN